MVFEYFRYFQYTLQSGFLKIKLKFDWKSMKAIENSKLILPAELNILDF